jgi:hypothetical protein
VFSLTAADSVLPKNNPRLSDHLDLFACTCYRNHHAK